MNNTQTILLSASMLIGASILSFGLFHRVAEPVRTITIQGEGKVSIVPTIYKANIHISLIGDNKKVLHEELTTVTKQVQEILVSQGIAANDIQTNLYNIHDHRIHSNNSAKQSGYQGSHSMVVTIRDTATIESLIAHLSELKNVARNGGHYVVDDSDVSH